MGAMRVVGSLPHLVHSRLEHFVRLNLPRPAVEVTATAGEEDGERVLARAQEDAADLLAREQLPVEATPLTRRRRPADVELVDAHEIGSSG